MHYANGAFIRCEGVLSSEFPSCSYLNTTAFLTRMIQSEKPYFIVFTHMGFLCFGCLFIKKKIIINVRITQDLHLEYPTINQPFIHNFYLYLFFDVFFYKHGARLMLHHIPHFFFGLGTRFEYIFY